LKNIFATGFKFYPQLETMDCGPACIKMIAAHYGRQYSLDYLKGLSDFSRLGTNFQSLSTCCQKIDFDTTAVKIPFYSIAEQEPGLQECPLPCIVHWREKHFVVVYEITDKYVKIADPAMGKVKLAVVEFIENWCGIAGENKEQTGNVLLMVPKNQDATSLQKTTSGNGNGVFSFLLPYIRPYYKSIIGILAGMVLIAALQFLVPVLNQLLVDKGISGKDIKYIQMILAGMLIIFLGRISAEIIQNWLFLNVGTRLNNTMMYDFLKKILHLPVRFFDQRTKGDLLQRMHEFNRLEQFITSQLISSVISILLLLVFGIVLFNYDKLIFTVFLLSSILYIAWILIFLKKRTVLDYQMFNKFAKQQNNLYEILEGVQDIKINNLEKEKYDRWKNEQDELFRMQQKNFRIDQWQKTGASFISQVKDIIITFYSAKAVVHGDITMGMMLSVLYIIGQLNLPLNQLVNFTQEFQNSVNSMRRINDVFKKESESIAGEYYKDRPVPNEAIILKDVSFFYSEYNKVIEGMNLNIPTGKTTAIVGSSGGGKSTLLKLLMRFYEPEKGAIFLGNQFLAAINLETWRNNCAAVLQNGFIFSDTLKYNITLNKEGTEEWLQEIIEQACISDIVAKLPQGIDTRIGEEGTQLSQGQKQRILIGRALYKNTPVLLFDEATNSLDTINETKILNNIREKQKGKTMVIVAHRLSTIKDADKIVVISNGSVAEEGTHDELMRLNGEYARLVQQQTGIQMDNNSK
jgi:ATP-binding cassette subfamily B protein